MVCAAAFLFAADGHIDFGKLVATLVGTALIIAAACVTNNVIDRNIDAHMVRTRTRAIVTGKVSNRAAWLFALVLAILGFRVLLSFVNDLTALVGFIGFISYVGLYSFAKRRTTHGTLIGTISGATPPVAGYVAVTNHLDTSAILLFLILVAWQMPHFYAIALYRAKEYKAADIPVLPLVRGNRRTKQEIIAYILAFIACCELLTLLGRAGYSFLAVMVVVGVLWLERGLHGFSANETVAWGKRLFLFSLIALLALSLMLALNPWLP